MKKANIFDPLDTAGILLSIVIILFIMWFINDEFSDSMKANNVTNITEVTDNMDTLNSRYVQAWDYSILIIAILFPLFSFIMARQIQSDTKMMVITWFVLGFLILIFMIIANIYGQMVDNPTFSEFIDHPKIKFIPLIMPNLTYYGMIYMAIVLIGLYSKSER